MTTSPTAPSSAELDAERGRILSRLVDLNVRIAELNGEAESLKAELRALPAGDYLYNGRPALRIVPTRRFDATAAINLVPAERRQECLKVEPDAAKIRGLLTPE